MLLLRVPLRMSWSGGATDVREYYSKGFGAVISTSINKYIYFTANTRFDNQIRLGYSTTETVDHPLCLDHKLAKECFLFTNITSGIEVTSVADISSKGSGLGSSSSYTVGLLHTLSTYKGIEVTKEQLAKDACHIEIDKLKNPIGKQDQYAAAYGGLNYIQFNSDETVEVIPIRLYEDKIKYLEDRLIMFYTGIHRNSSVPLLEQRNNIINNKDTTKVLDKMVEQTVEMKSKLESGDVLCVPDFMNKNWELKKKLAKCIATDDINKWYNTGMKNGAISGKLLGAGSGGFILFYCEPENQERLKESLKELRPMYFKFDKEGSKVLYNEG